MQLSDGLPITEPPLPSADEATPLPELTSESPQATEPVSMQRRLWILFPLVALGTSAVSGGVNSALLAKLIATFPGGEDVGAAATLGLALSISGITYLVAGPLGGIMSDRTRTRFLGRRNLWVLIGAIATAIALVALGRATTVPALVVLASLSTIPLSVTLAAGGAVLPERVPIANRGRMASMYGLMGLVGAGVGIAGAALAPTVFVGFVVLAVQLVVFCALFAFFTRDIPTEDIVAAEQAASHEVRPKFPTPKSHPDYWWAFAGRGLAFMAFGLATGLQLYALRDHFKVGDGSTDAASITLSQITVFSTLALAVAAIVGGILVDKLHRVKPFVIAASLIFVPGALILSQVHSTAGAFIGFTVIGFAFGSYIAVDQVLLSLVIPNKTNAGRDLGLLNVSGSVGSIAAPALAGVLVASTGYGFVFLLVVVAGALAAGCVLFIRGVR